MSRRVVGVVSAERNVKGNVSPSAAVRITDIEQIVMDMLLKLEVAPVLLDAEGAMLADADGNILVFGGNE